MFGRYAERSGWLNYQTLYERVLRNKVDKAHGQYKSLAATQAEYQDQLGRSAYPPNGRPFVGGARVRSGQLRSVLSR